MLPSTIIINTETLNESLPSTTYRLDFAGNRIYGMITEKEALFQSIEKLLRTKRYSTPIYTGDYGVELDDLVGQSLSYIEADLPRRIREALLQDDRITSVDSIVIKQVASDVVEITITVSTVFGSITTKSEVTL